MKNKKAQIWVETVIYTLIGLVLIGTVLAFATPLIQKEKDKTIIERTSNALSQLDNAILTVKRAGIGNVREIDFSIGEGALTVDGDKDLLSFKFEESSYAYSEPRVTIDVSGTNIKARTDKSGNKFDVTLILNYNGTINITYQGKDIKRTLGASPNPYRLIIENKGSVPPNLINVNIYDAS